MIQGKIKQGANGRTQGGSTEKRKQSLVGLNRFWVQRRYND